MWLYRATFVVLSVAASLLIIRANLSTWACLGLMLVIGALSVSLEMKRRGHLRLYSGTKSPASEVAGCSPSNTKTHGPGKPVASPVSLNRAYTEPVFPHFNDMGEKNFAQTGTIYGGVSSVFDIDSHVPPSSPERQLVRMTSSE